MRIISIEGNIGSGKSTVINNLKQLYKQKYDHEIYFLEEPVNEWTEVQDLNGTNIIEKFYNDQHKYSFSFQMMAYISRLALLKKAIKYCNENNINLIICERSLETDKNVFCKMLYDAKKIEEVNYQIYLKWFDEFITEIPKIYYVYIKTDPIVAFQRVLERNRKGEKISLIYLEDCSKYHDYWLTNDTTGTILVDGNKSSHNVYDQIIKVIDGFINF